MKKVPIIKTKKLKKAIDRYYKFKYELQRDFGSVLIPSWLSEEFDSICEEIFNAAHAENKSCGIIAGTIVLGEKMGLGRKRTGWINSTSENHTPEWDIREEMFNKEV